MNAINITCIAILSVLLGLAGPAYGQSEQGEKQNHPGQQQNKPDQQHAQQQRQANQKQHQPQHPEQRQDQDQHPQQAQQQQRQDRNNHQQHAQQQNNRPAQRTQQQQRVQQSAWQQHRSQNWQSDHRNWQQRGGYRGYRIPDDRYRGYFGPSHGFRINALPFLVVGGYPRFQYEGYWISAVDPWPSSWGDDWYDNDDVYVSYVDNGYYMYNRSYPGQGIAINITF